MYRVWSIHILYKFNLHDKRDCARCIFFQKEVFVLCLTCIQYVPSPILGVVYNSNKKANACALYPTFLEDLVLSFHVKSDPLCIRVLTYLCVGEVPRSNGSCLEVVMYCVLWSDAGKTEIQVQKRGLQLVAHSLRTWYRSLGLRRWWLQRRGYRDGDTTNGGSVAETGLATLGDPRQGPWLSIEWTNAAHFAGRGHC